MTPRTPNDAGSLTPYRPGLTVLLLQSATGDEAAFAEVYDRTASDVYGLALAMLRDPVDAEDAARRAFVEIWRTAPRFVTGGVTATGWILATAHALLVDVLRADRTDEEHEGVRASIARTAGALVALPAAQRAALMLAYLDGRSHTEVAALTGVPVEVAASRIRAGLVGLYELR